MEKNELFYFGDLPMSELMQHADSSDEITFGDLPMGELVHCDDESEYIDYGISGDTPVDDLEHSGVKGMKWGVRRYQNKDGSLTPAGKKRYNQELSKVRAAEKVVKTKQATKAKIDKLNERKKAVEDADAELESVPGRARSKSKKSAGTSVETTPKKKTAKDMSDDELNTAIKRMQLEKQFNTLQSELNPKKESMGKDFVKKLTRNALDATAEGSKSAVKSFMEKKLKEALGVDDKSAQKVKTALEKLKEEADEIKTRKEMLENKAKIQELESMDRAAKKVEAKLDKVKAEKQLLAEEKQLEYLKREKAQGWPENNNNKKDKKNQNK